MKKTKYICLQLLPLLVLIAAAPMLNAGQVPDFSLKTMEGASYKLSEHLGKKVILIEFWATWCKPCKKFMKKLNLIHQEYRDKIDVLAISTDDASAFPRVESYIKGKGYGFTVLLDPAGRVVRVFNPSQKIPFTLIIDKNGKIVFTHTGYMPGYEKEVIKQIEKLIR